MMNIMNKTFAKVQTLQRFERMPKVQGNNRKIIMNGIGNIIHAVRPCIR